MVRRWLSRGAVLMTLLLVVAMVLNMAPPDDAALSATGPSLSMDGVLSWLSAGLTASVGWAAPRSPKHPTGPAQPSGTAAGRSHLASAAATRAGRGAGHKPGKGKGELPPATPITRRQKSGPSGNAVRGFVKATSVADSAKSTATSTYYDNADGSHSRVLSTGPINYRDSTHKWRPIDTAVQRGSDGRWRERGNSVNLQFAPYADDASVVSLATDATHRITEGLVGAAHVAGVATKSTVTYPAALPGTDLHVQATRTGEKESIVLRDASAAPQWDFALGLDGLSAALAADGSVRLRSAAGKVLMTIPAGYAWDSAPAPPGPVTTHGVKYTLDGSNLHVSLDPTWLHDPARVFPVTVDPAFGFTPLTTYAEQGSAPADHSLDDLIRVGTGDNGVHLDRSFLSFPDLGLEKSGVSVTAASLAIFQVWTSSCTTTRFDVAPITEAWSPASVRTYPGPALGASIGGSTPNTTKACVNTSKNPAVGDAVSMPLAVATFNSWSTGASAAYGLGLYTAVTTGTTNLKYFASDLSLDHSPQLTLTFSGFPLPYVLKQNPANGTAVDSLTPTLSAIGANGRGVVDGSKFLFQVYNSGGVRVAYSGNTTNSWTVPAGSLQWGQVYSWSVQAFDGTNYSVDPPWYQFSTQVPQPAVTSTLSQNPGHGFDASIGNYTTSSTDAQVSTVGPELSIDRSYNSRDPRAGGAFGAAWSTAVDARVAEKYNPGGAVGTVVVTYPDGSDVGYGRNADGTFTAPSGRASTLIRLAAGYELIDKSDTTYLFSQALATAGTYGITSITDSHKRAETFAWDSGHVTALVSAASGRALHLTWSTPPVATAAHVATVVTDPAVAGEPGTAKTWTYGYTGDQLTSVCPPGTTTACTTYGYDPHATSQARNVLLDLGAQSYWPLSETSGTKAGSVIAASEGTDNASYTGVTLGANPGPLASSSAHAATFNGTTSRVNLPDLRLSSSITDSISLWFKAAKGIPAGVLWSMSDIPMAATGVGDLAPTLYIGTDGKLLGEFWITSTTFAANPIETGASVTDGLWHNVVLTQSAASQVMFLDGKQVGSPIPGPGYREEIAPWEYHYNYLGTGYLGPSYDGVGVWPDQPHTDATTPTSYASYFKGDLADAAFWEGKDLTAGDAAAIYQAGLHPGTEMTSATRPSGKAFAMVAYDGRSGAVTQVTDENGGTWGLSQPTTTGSSQVYRGAVLGSDPLAYYRLGDAAGATHAYSEVNYAPGDYTSTTLGAPGPFDYQGAAAFNGTSSSVQVPKDVFPSGPSSQELWFKTSATSTGEVLLSEQNSTLGSTTCPCRPVLWVTPDGTLRALAPSLTPTGPFRARTLVSKCLDLSGSVTANGTHIQVWDCNGSSAQNYTLAADGTLQVIGHCVDLTGGAKTAGTKVELDACNGAATQVWQPFGSGLKNVASGLCLDDPATARANGTQFQIAACVAGSSSQSWIQSLASTTVADGGWHHALLAGTGTAQTLYLDGVKAASSTGSVAFVPGSLPFAQIGGGYSGAQAAGSSVDGLAFGTTSYFKGSLGEAAFYRTALSSADDAAHFTAARNSTGVTPLTTVSVTDPGGKPLVNQYDPLNNNRQVAAVDALGHKTSFGYDAAGFLHTTTDANGNVTTTGHDDAGNVVSTTTCQNRAANTCSTRYATFQPTIMGVDVAKAATVTSSSTVTTAGVTTAAMVDGNTTSVSGALGFSSALQTAAASTQWVQVDLGATKTVDQVALYPRTDVAGGFPLTFTIQVSTDGTSFQPVSTQANYPVPGAGKQANLTFAPVSARYVKLNATALRAASTAGKFSLELGELSVLNDRPDPLAGVQLTQRDARSTSATDSIYLTTYGYNTLGDVTTVTTPPVAGSPNGRTTKIDYTDGNTIAAADSGIAPAGLPYRTTSPGGAVSQVGYLHNGDVASTTDADGLVTRFGYDNLGRVGGRTVVSDSYPAGLTTTYSYDDQDQVVSETAPPVADRITGKVHTAQTSRVYDPDGDVTSQTAADTTGGDITRTTTTTFNAFDQVYSTTDAEQHTTTFAYDVYGNRNVEIDPKGNRTEYTFDANGQLLTQVLANYIGDPVNPQPAHALTELSRAYDPAGRLASITSAMGFTTTYKYTDDGLPVSATRTDQNGQNAYVDKSDSYDAAGNLIQEVTNNGATTTTVTVDAASRPIATTVDPNGVNRTSTITYTSDDAIATNVTSDGSGATVTTTATYDEMGRTKSKAMHSNSPGYTDDLSVSWDLDQRGLPRSQTDPNHNVTDYTYDEAGRLVVTAAPAVDVESGGAAAVHIRPTTKQGFDTFGEKTADQDAVGNITTTGYDRLGRAVSTTMPDYFAPGSMIPISVTVTSKYDSAGDLVEQHDADLNLTSYVYDQLGDLALKTTPDGGATHSTYDLNGELQSVTDPNGGERQATYDHLGRPATSTVIDRYPNVTALTTKYSYAPSTTNPGGAWLASTTSPAGVASSTGYDNLGETTSTTDGAGNTTTYQYDLMGRQIGQVAPDRTSNTIAFDQIGDPVTRKALDADGTVLTARSAAYDPNGNLRSSTDARGHTTTFTYDALNSLTAEAQPVTASSSITTSFGHDAAGDRTRLTDGRGNNWTYTYNSWGLPESTVEPPTATYSTAADRTTTTVYDERALPVTQTEPGGVTVSNAYDVVGNLKTSSGTGADAATATRTFGYDLNQRLTSATTDPAPGGPATAETFGYDDRGDLTSATGDAGSSSFAYNDDGAMTSRTDAAGSAGYTYDSADRLKTVDDAATGTRMTLSYNKLSQVSSMAYGDNGNVRSFGYDALHRLTSDRLATNDDATVATIGYGYDDNGNVTSKTTSGFTASAANAYTYDWANRLTSWDDGTTTTGYGYDDSGNRTRVGADVYTYDARDQLTSDGKSSYEYTARGTRSKQNDVVSTSDAFGQAISPGSGQSYAYDALGRTLTDTVGAAVTRFAYSGAGNDVASDGTNTYSRDPGGSLLGVGVAGGTQGDARLALADTHTDIVGTFTATGTALAGSTAYDPLGNVISTSGQMGRIGYQSGWTDPNSGNVNMAARWYSPGTGQFMNKDTVAQNPVPNAAAANPFAFVDDNPMTGTDPTGHGWLSSAWHGATSLASSAWSSTKSAWNATTSWAVSTWHAASNWAVKTWDSGVNWVENKYTAISKKVEDAWHREQKKWNDWEAAQERKFKAYNAKLKREAQAVQRQVRQLEKTAGELAQTGIKYVKNHAAAIATFVVSTAVFVGCEAVLGAATGGVGAVAGAVACGALSGAVGGLVNQGFACAKNHGASCSSSAFLKAGVVGGVIGGLSGLGGALGGKLLKAVGGRAMSAVGGLFGRGGSEVASGAAEGTAEGSTVGETEGAVESTASSADKSNAARSGQSDEPAAGEESKSPNCESQPHSFTGSTRVLLADGSTKAIDQVKVGDKVKDAVPGEQSTETHTVDRVIVTTTDRDFVDVTIAASKPSKTTAKLVKAGLTLAAGVAALATAGSPAVLTATFHHPFYDKTKAAFVQAADLIPGDDLQTPTGTAKVLAKRTYHATAVTYDLTINGLHTYYVVAGELPILVHNCDLIGTARAAGRSAPEDATMSAAARFRGTDLTEIGHSGPSSRPKFLEPEIESELQHGGQMFAGDASNCAEVRACNLLIANHGAAFEEAVGRPLTFADIEFVTVRSSTGAVEPACLSCQSVLIRNGAADLSR